MGPFSLGCSEHEIPGPAPANYVRPGGRRALSHLPKLVMVDVGVERVAFVARDGVLVHVTWPHHVVDVVHGVLVPRVGVDLAPRARLPCGEHFELDLDVPAVNAVVRAGGGVAEVACQAGVGGGMLLSENGCIAQVSEIVGLVC